MCITYTVNMAMVREKLASYLLPALDLLCCLGQLLVLSLISSKILVSISFSFLLIEYIPAVGF